LKVSFVEARGGKLRIKGLLAFEDAVGLAQEVMHDGADDAHVGFARGAQAFGPVFEDRIAARADDGGEVEGLPQAPVAGFAQACFAAHGAAGLAMGRAQARVGGDLAGVVEVFDFGQFGQEDGGGAIADAGNAFEQGGFVFELRGAGQDLLDFSFEPADGLPEVFDECFDFAHGGRALHAAFEAVFLLLELLFAAQQQAREILQQASLGRRRFPQGRVLFAAKEGHQRGIDLVVLVTREARLGVVLDASWIDDADLVAGFLQMCSQAFPEASGGFHAGVDRTGLELFEPADELFPAGQGVLEGAAVLLIGPKEHRIELVFGDI